MKHLPELKLGTIYMLIGVFFAIFLMEIVDIMFLGGETNIISISELSVSAFITISLMAYAFTMERART